MLILAGTNFRSFVPAKGHKTKTKSYVIILLKYTGQLAKEAAQSVGSFASVL